MHCHKYDTVNSQWRTLKCGGKRKHFEHNTTNNGCIAHHCEHSKLNYRPKTANLKVTEQTVDSEQQILTMTANSEQHKLNKCFLGVWHSIDMC